MGWRTGPGTVAVRLVLLIHCIGLSSDLSAQQAEPVALPARFVHDRVFVRPVSVAGDTLNLLTDTGGGIFLTSDAVARLGLAIQTATAQGQSADVTTLPELEPPSIIPAVPIPPDSQGSTLQRILAGRVFVYPSSGLDPDYVGDGVLGEAWFGGRTWILDYPAGEFLALSAASPDVAGGSGRVPIFFKSGPGNQPLGYHPRVQAIVAGDTIDFLFDTGATVALADSAYAALGENGGRIRGTSFIIEYRFERWREQHPEWRVVDRAESGTGQPMIEVPEVTIAGHVVGPVWFTRRPDPAFREYMSEFMDQPIDGALGGSLFKYFRILVNYPLRFAVFEQ